MARKASPEPEPEHGKLQRDHVPREARVKVCRLCRRYRRILDGGRGPVGADSHRDRMAPYKTGTGA